jgi:hypothetical protein
MAINLQPSSRIVVIICEDYLAKEIAGKYQREGKVNVIECDARQSAEVAALVDFQEAVAEHRQNGMNYKNVSIRNFREIEGEVATAYGTVSMPIRRSVKINS